MHGSNFQDLTGPLRAGRVAQVTLGLIAARRRDLGLVWLALAAVNLAGFALIAQDSGGSTLPFGPQDALQCAVVALLSMAAVRILLGAGAIWRLDRGGLVFAGVDFASSVAIAFWWAGWSLVFAPEEFGFPLSEPNFAAAVLRGAAWIAVGVAVWWVFIRIALWAYDQAVDARRFSIPESWRETRGAAWPIIAATMVVAILPSEIPLTILGAFEDRMQSEVLRTLGSVFEAGLMAWYSLGVVAVPAAVYRLRSGRSGEGAVAEVFD